MNSIFSRIITLKGLGLLAVIILIHAKMSYVRNNFLTHLLRDNINNFVTVGPLNIKNKFFSKIILNIFLFVINSIIFKTIF